MIKYQQITQSYPLAIISALTEFYHPQTRWQQIENPVDAVLEFDQFNSQVEELIQIGVTRLGFSIQDHNKTQYTIHITTKELTAPEPVKPTRLKANRLKAVSALGN